MDCFCLSLRIIAQFYLGVTVSESSSSPATPDTPATPAATPQTGDSATSTAAAFIAGLGVTAAAVGACLRKREN